MSVDARHGVLLLAATPYDDAIVDWIRTNADGRREGGGSPPAGARGVVGLTPSLGQTDHP
jgi:hypothetical protein